jgi:PAS domain S-box-containing protein
MQKKIISELGKKDIFRILFESAGEGLVLVDSEGRILLVNPRIEELFQYKDYELIGRHIEILVPESLRDKHIHHREGYTSHPRKRSMMGTDLLGQRRDGSTFPVEVSLNYFRAEDELLIMGLITDNTERRKAQMELQKLNTELEERVLRRTQELADAIRDLELSNKSLEKAQEEVRNALDKEKELSELKSRFVSTASHEFRTPLATILSSVSLIGKYTGESEAGKREKHITRIKSAVHNMKAILNDFLNVEKLEEGKVLNLPQTFSLREFMEELADELQTLCKPGQEIRYEHHGEGDLVTLDPRLLKNIMLNLLSNAIKFSPEESVVELLSLVTPDRVSVTVRDSGIGISQEDQEHLFQRFFRAKNSINIQGTGLGLNIVRSYVELMGGEISFSSQLNSGTTFIVELPSHTLHP